MTLDEAQKAKHQFIERELNIKKGQKVLDMGCGWGPFLNYISKKGVNVVGLTLSDGQYNACRKNGFEVYIKDVRSVQPADFGIFDAVVSVGAFEHFCSIEEYKQGKQEQVYRDFFKTVFDLLPPGGRFFLQTMSFEKNMIPLEEIDLNAKKNSDAYILALCRQHLPGSWLPYGSDMIIRCAEPYFEMINISNGRLDYIETIRVWRKMLRKFSFGKYALYLQIFLDSLKSNKLRHLVQVFRVSPLMVCLEREIMGHYRIVFEKKSL
jgi:cyclopropane-fatty-acyl-phospholipid synthase